MAYGGGVGAASAPEKTASLNSVNSFDPSSYMSLRHRISLPLRDYGLLLVLWI